jgi:hypothetical protein
MSGATSGTSGAFIPGCRFAHPGYNVSADIDHRFVVAGPGAESPLRLLLSLSRNGSGACVVVGGITALFWFGWGRRRCRCFFCDGCRLRRGRHVIRVIEAQPRHARPSPCLALFHAGVKAFDAAAIASVDFHANGIARIVPLSRCRRRGDDRSDPKDQPNQAAHLNPPM